MKLPFSKKKKNHLRYSTIAGWMKGEHVPANFAVEYGSGRRPDFKPYMNQFCELRQHLYDIHVLTLSQEAQRQLREGEHPSQTHKKAEMAEPVLKNLKHLLNDHTSVEEVHIKTAQMNMVQFNVVMKPEATQAEIEAVPEYIEGYVINVRLRGRRPNGSA